MRRKTAKPAVALTIITPARGNVKGGSGIHAGHEAAGVVDADGDGVSGGAAAGGACRGDAGDDALKGAVADGVGGDLGLLAHRDVEDVQLVYVQGHLEVAQIVDDAHGLGGGRTAAHGVADLRPFLSNHSFLTERLIRSSRMPYRVFASVDRS